MSDSKVPLEPPPSYDEAGAEHTPLMAGEKSASPAKRQSVVMRGPLPLELPSLVALRGKRVILASASPRRKQLLAQIGLTKVDVVPSTVPEDFSKTLTPFEYVLLTAEQKAMNVYQAELDSPKGDPALVIAADTVVVSTLGEILEKPRSEKEHFAVLKSLRNQRSHKVFTAVVVMAPREDAIEPGYSIKTHVEETVVKFDTEVTDELILAYVKTREGADKAGGYGIQGMGTILIDRIEGTYDNVVGLPLKATLKLIEQALDPELGVESEDE